MSGQLEMFGPTISEDIGSATSSPGSEPGATPSDSRDGQTIAKSGPDPVPASHSARPESTKRSTTKGIFGQLGFNCSRHDDLSYALASRYRRLTDSLGSTLFELTWMTRVTPAGFSIPAQRASEPRTEGSVFIGWPTPNAGPQNLVDSRWEKRREALREKHINGNGFGLNLGMATSLASWPTPQLSDTTGGGQAKRSDGRANLNDFVMLASWPTPGSNEGSGKMRPSREATNRTTGYLAEMATLTSWPTPTMLAGWKTPCVPNGGRISGNKTDIGKHHDGTKAQIGLENEAKLSGWQTPTTNDGKGSDYTYTQGNHDNPFLKLPGEARLTAFGQTPTGCLLGPNGWEIVPASGQLNPAHSRWLQGVPQEWDQAAIAAFRSLKKRKRG